MSSVSPPHPPPVSANVSSDHAAVHEPVSVRQQRQDHPMNTSYPVGAAEAPPPSFNASQADGFPLAQSSSFGHHGVPLPERSAKKEKDPEKYGGSVMAASNVAYPTSVTYPTHPPPPRKQEPVNDVPLSSHSMGSVPSSATSRDQFVTSAVPALQSSGLGPQEQQSGRGKKHAADAIAQEDNDSPLAKRKRLIQRHFGGKADGDMEHGVQNERQVGSEASLAESQPYGDHVLNSTQPLQAIPRAPSLSGTASGYSGQVLPPLSGSGALQSPVSVSPHATELVRYPLSFTNSSNENTKATSVGFGRLSSRALAPSGQTSSIQDDVNNKADSPGSVLSRGRMRFGKLSNRTVSSVMPESSGTALPSGSHGTSDSDADSTQSAHSASPGPLPPLNKSGPARVLSPLADGRASQGSNSLSTEGSACVLSFALRDSTLLQDSTQKAASPDPAHVLQSSLNQHQSVPTRPLMKISRLSRLASPSLASSATKTDRPSLFPSEAKGGDRSSAPVKKDPHVPVDGDLGAGHVIANKPTSSSGLGLGRLSSRASRVS